MELTKKNTGRNAEYHSGWSLLGVMRNREPRDDWCMVESTTPNTVSGMVMASTTFLIFLSAGRMRFRNLYREGWESSSFTVISHSMATGDHSMNSTKR